jgi:hypothetical protein
VELDTAIFFVVFNSITGVPDERRNPLTRIDSQKCQITVLFQCLAGAI